MISRMTSAGIIGFEASLIEIEVDVCKGMSAVVVVGLPDTSIKESRDRVKSAILNSGFSFPQKKITINLAPADLRKEGPVYDLPMALGILQASQQIPENSTEEYGILGELALDGRLRPIKGSLVAAVGMKKKGIRKLFLPLFNAKEAALAEGMEIYGARNLEEVVGHFRREKLLSPWKNDLPIPEHSLPERGPDFGEVVGQTLAKRALAICAAGNHNLLMVGPPGSGKTMLARCLPTILPPLSLEEKMEVTGIYSIAGILDPEKGLVQERPFRSPHHTISEVGLVGGGSFPRPGEISLSHHGVLFLDELPEFSRRTLEVLRQPLEEGLVRIGRANASVTFPSQILFLSAMNPCPCGYLTHPEKNCRCSSLAVQRYIGRISGPLLDRIDLQIEVQRLPLEHLMEEKKLSIPSQEIAQKVLQTRTIQKERFLKRGFWLNSQMGDRDVKKFCTLSPEAKKVFHQAYRHFHLSGRSYKKMLKVARTIADLEGKDIINSEHIAEVVHLRNLEKLFV